MKRKRRSVFWEQGVSSLFIFAYCLSLAAAVVAQRELVFKLLQFILFLILAGASGKRLQVIGTGLVFVSTVLFSLLAPEGRVILNLPGWPLTEEALANGLRRALTLTTCYYLSKAFIHSRLRFHGRVGLFLACVFHNFAYLSDRLHSLKLKTFSTDLDRLLLGAEQHAPRFGTDESTAGLTVTSAIFYASVLAGNLFLLILSSSPLGT